METTPIWWRYPMELPGTKRGSWAIAYAPSGRVTTVNPTFVAANTWVTLVEHEPTGWQIVHGEREPVAHVVSPAGALMDLVDVTPLPNGMADSLIATLTTWVGANATRLGEPTITPDEPTP